MTDTDGDAGPSFREVLGVAVVVVLVLLRSRRRRRRAARSREADAPTVPAVDGRTSAVQPTSSLAPAGDVPGRPRLASVHAGTLPHGALAAPVPAELPLPVGEHVVGRSAGADVRLDEPTVSPRHALVTVAATGEVEVRDLGALNGLRVDGVPVAGTRLFDGNRLDLGQAQLVFRCDPLHDDGGRQGGELGEQPHQRAEGRD